MQRLCNSPICRHRALVEYFGQEYDRENCAACDVCLADVEYMEGSTVAAQKILSCVARVNESYGVGHLVDVLVGSNTDAVRRANHDGLSTYGLLKDMPKKQVQSLIYQLVDQGLLDRTAGDRPIIKLNALSWEILRGQREAKLLKPKQEANRSKADSESWEGVDRELFEHLRAWRHGIAREHQVPAYVIVNDSTLRDLARVRPTNESNLRQISGMGEKRVANFGVTVMDLIKEFCAEHKLSIDQTIAPTNAFALDESATYIKAKRPNAVREQALEFFRQGWSIDDVKHKINRARSTVAGYLTEFISEEKPANIRTWVADDIYRKVCAAAAECSERRLTPIFERLDGRIPYDTIRLVLAHVESQAD
jgi:ATP-dependent DNA helicase RecQ